MLKFCKSLLRRNYIINKWRGEYTYNYIEEMTQKANSQRKYQVFVKMLLAALDKSSEVVFVDFITFQDLEIFKAKRNNDPDKMLKAQSINSQKNSRRYLIMTFSNDMEQVHYPLVLSQVNSNDTGELKEVLNRLSVAYEEAKSFDTEARLSSYSNTTNEFFRKGMAEYNPLIEENEQLKKKYKMLLKAKEEVETMSSHSVPTSAIKFKNSPIDKLELGKGNSKIEDTKTEGNVSQLGETQNSFKSFDDEIEVLRTRLSTVSIELENKRKEYKKTIYK